MSFIIKDDVRGSALISDCGQYRYYLRRDWGEAYAPYALWIGMNPSTADDLVDDPTIRKEMHYTRQLGLTSLVKCNVMDYRSPYPSALLKVNPRSDRNIEKILAQAARAERVIAAWGVLPKSLRRYADEAVEALDGIPLYCMGVTKDGSPRHPLYLRNDAECRIWRTGHDRQ